MRCAEQHHAMIRELGRPAHRRERAIAGLARRLLGHQRVEDRVDPGQDGLDGAEVLHQGHLGAGADKISRLVEQCDIGATEPVDGLLRIADEEQPARWQLEVTPIGRVVRRVGRDTQGELDLDGIGVLELVEQHAGISLVHIAPRRRARAQQPSRQHQQVVELELSGIASLVGGRQRDLMKHAEPDRQHIVDRFGAQRRSRIVDRGNASPRRFDIGPGLLGALASG